MMDKQNNSFCNKLTVIWRRNNSTHRSILIPKVVEINIDDSAKKVKEPPKSYNISCDIKKIRDGHSHKRVKRSLFQENKKDGVNKCTTLCELNTKHDEHSDVSDELSEVSIVSCSRSPVIVSNREKLKVFQDISSLETKSCLFETESKINNELFLTNSVNNTLNNNQSLCYKDEWFETNLNNSIKNVKSSLKSDDFLLINKHNNEYPHKSVRRSLFQDYEKDNVYKLLGLSKINVKHCEPHNNNLEIKLDGLSEVSVLSCPRSPTILSNREKVMIHQDISCHELKLQKESTKRNELSIPSSVDKSSIQSSVLIDQIKPSTKTHFGLKSPEVMSSQRRYIEYNSINKKVTYNHDKININYKCSTKSSNNINEISKNLNISSSKTHSKSNLIDSEDIIESTEILYPPYKQKSKKQDVGRHNKKPKLKDFVNENQIQGFKTFVSEKYEKSSLKDNLKKNIAIAKITKKELSNGINFDSLDIINTENILKSPDNKFKSIPYKSKKSLKNSYQNQNHVITELLNIDKDIQKHYSDMFDIVSVPPDSKKIFENTTKENFKMLKSYRTGNLNQNKDQKILSSDSLITLSVIPATPEPIVVTADKPTIVYSPETLLNSYVPMIEVDHSPTSLHEKNADVHIQSVYSPPNQYGNKSPGLFEPVVSPTQSFSNVELPFKIDSIESPCAISENGNFMSLEMYRKKSNNSPSPNYYDSAKKRKKVSKDGLRGKFRDLINRKKSEACIREYEKNFSKSYQPKHNETVLLRIVEAWKEFRTYVLLCHHMKSDIGVQKVLVTLDNCPKNATKNSIIRIYSPWLAIESKTTEMLLFVGVIHAEVIQLSGSTIPPEPIEFFTKLNGLMTTVFQSKVVWKCYCPKEAGCQCLGELSVYNYLQYMI